MLSVLLWLLVPVFTYEAVQVLTEADFYAETETGRWVLDFYAPWCPHCMKLEPIFLDAARRLQAEKIRVKFAKINCEAESKLCKDLGVNGYPDLKFSAWGYRTEWTLGRSLEEFLQFGRSLNVPMLQPLPENLEAVPKLLKFILVGANSEQQSEYGIIAEKLRSLDDVAFYHATKFDSEKGPVVVRLGDNPYLPKQVFSPTQNATRTLEWIVNHSLPMFPEITHVNWRMMGEKSLFVAVLDPSNHQSFRHAMKEVASQLTKEVKSQYKVGWFDANKYSRFLSRTFYLDEYPSLLLVSKGTQIYFVDRKANQATLDDKYIRSFLQAIEEEKIQSEGTGTFKGGLWNAVMQFYFLLSDEPLLVGGLSFLVVLLVSLILCMAFTSDVDGDDKED